MTKANVDASTITLWEPRMSPHFKKFVRSTKRFDSRCYARPNDNGRNWKDWYIMRLAETYLLRAEANMLKGDATTPLRILI
jgi:hypothetical protein